MSFGSGRSGDVVAVGSAADVESLDRKAVAIGKELLHLEFRISRGLGFLGRLLAPHGGNQHGQPKAHQPRHDARRLLSCAIAMEEALRNEQVGTFSEIEHSELDAPTIAVYDRVPAIGALPGIVLKSAAPISRQAMMNLRRIGSLLIPAIVTASSETGGNSRSLTQRKFSISLWTSSVENSIGLGA